MAIVGLRHAQFKELVAAGELPQPIKLTDGGRTVAWLEDELIKWRNERIAARDAAADTKKPRRAAKRGAK